VLLWQFFFLFKSQNGDKILDKDGDPSSFGGDALAFHFITRVVLWR